MQPNLEALRQLKRVVGAVPPADFNLARWKCGTVVCALGAAALDPWFNEQGLHMGNMPAFSDATGFHVGFYAGSAILSISVELSEYLFDPIYYGVRFVFTYAQFRNICSIITRERVIARIDEVIDMYTVPKDAHVNAWIEHREAERALNRDFSSLLQVEHEPA